MTLRDTEFGRREFFTLGFARNALRARATEQTEPWRLPDVALYTHAGESVHFYEDLVRDHVVVIHLLCAGWEGQARVLKTLERVHDLLKDRFGSRAWLLSLSIDVDDESPELPTARTGIENEADRWLTLTGDTSAIDAIRRAIGAWDPDPRLDADRTRYAGLLTLGSDRTGRWASLPALVDPTDVIARVRRLDNS